MPQSPTHASPIVIYSSSSESSTEQSGGESRGDLRDPDLDCDDTALSTSSEAIGVLSALQTAVTEATDRADLPGPSNVEETSSVPTAFTTSSLPNDIAQIAAFPPVQPVNITFPQTKFGKSSRSFNAAWYNRYKWLEYSVQRDACFCYPCHIFGTTSFGVSRPESSFTVTGFRNWKKATGKNGTLCRHENSIAHKNAEVAWDQYKQNLKKGTSISEQHDSQRATTIMQNRHYLKTVIEALLYCAQQEVALRGHREGIDSHNRGNFLELLTLIGKHDPIVQQRLENGPKNAKYTSPDIQNTLLRLMASNIQAIRERMFP